MSSVRINPHTTATASAAFVATITGCLASYIPVEYARPDHVAKALGGVVLKIHRTAGQLNLFNQIQKSQYVVADFSPMVAVRTVTRVEDLVLRRATLRSGRLISKGRFVSK